MIVRYRLVRNRLLLAESIVIALVLGLTARWLADPVFYSREGVPSPPNQEGGQTKNYSDFLEPAETLSEKILPPEPWLPSAVQDYFELESGGLTRYPLPPVPPRGRASLPSKISSSQPQPPQAPGFPAVPEAPEGPRPLPPPPDQAPELPGEEAAAPTPLIPGVVSVEIPLLEETAEALQDTVEDVLRVPLFEGEKVVLTLLRGEEASAAQDSGESLEISAEQGSFTMDYREDQFRITDGETDSGSENEDGPLEFPLKVSSQSDGISLGLPGGTEGMSVRLQVLGTDILEIHPLGSGETTIHLGL